MNKIVCVLTTVKNGELYLEETLQSVLNQTYKNYEHIIIDDGSTDNTWEIIEYFIEEHPKNKINSIKTVGVGRARALNMGVENSTGEWIAIIDADDLWHPKKLECQMACLTKKPDIDVLGTKTGLFSVNEEVVHKEVENGKANIITKNQLLKNCILSHSSVLIKKEYCFYNESRNSQLDYELWLRLITQGKKLANLNVELNYHRIHEHQSFERKQGNNYRWKGFKLTLPFILKYKAYYILFIKIIKLLLATFLPMSIVRKIIKLNQ